MMTLILLPGLDGTGWPFSDFIHGFASDVNIIVVPYPTHTVLGYTELISIARTFLPKEQPFFLLGESFSGPIAIAIAASQPPGLLGLILCCSFARNPRPRLSVLRPLLSIAPIAILPIALLSFFVLGRFSSARLRRLLAKSLAQVSPAVLRARARAALSIDVSASLPRVNVPLLYLRAAEDRIVPKAASQLITSFIPTTTTVVFPAPHFLLQVLPSQTAATVREFMDDHRGLYL